MTSRRSRQGVPRVVALAVAASLGTGCASSRGAWRPDATVMDVQRPSGPEFFGIYLARQKVGAAESSVTLEERGGVRVLVSRHVTTLMASVGPTAAVSTRFEEKVYEARPEGRLLAFVSKERSKDGSGFAVEGTCRREGCVASVVRGERREERQLPPVDETAEQADPARLVAAGRAGLTGRQLVVERLGVVETKVRSVGTDRLREGESVVDVVVVEETGGSDRQPTRWFFAQDGRLLEGRIGQIVMRAEPREQAASFKGPLANLAAITRVRLPAELPRDVPARVTFRVRGVPRAFQLADARQAWKAQADGSALVTVTAHLPAAGSPERDTPRAGGVAPTDALFLAPTPIIDSDAPSVQAAAHEIARDTTGSYAASLAIMRRLSSQMAPSSASSSSCASEALGRPRGTSDERARLFTALARAAGVPARQVHGLVYRNFGDGIPALYWRAWVEVKSGGEWIALDPELDQAVADATHLKLGRSDQDDAFALVGAIEVLSVSADVKLPDPRR